jgi:hypothetical protein
MTITTIRISTTEIVRPPDPQRKCGSDSTAFAEIDYQRLSASIWPLGQLRKAPVPGKPSLLV